MKMASKQNKKKLALAIIKKIPLICQLESIEVVLSLEDNIPADVVRTENCVKLGKDN